MFEVPLQEFIAHCRDQHGALHIVGGAMRAGRIDAKFGVLARVGQGSQQLHGMHGMDIVIAHGMDEEEMVLQVGGMVISLLFR